jgi:transposase
MDRKRPRRKQPGANAVTINAPVELREPDLAEELVWSRIQELRAIDEDLNTMEQALVTILELHQKTHANVRQELGLLSVVGSGMTEREPELTRSFGFYFNKLIEILKGFQPGNMSPKSIQ